MAEIVNLQPVSSLPDDASFVLVKGNSSGTFDITIWTGSPSKTTIAYDTNVAPLFFATQRANEQADRRGLSVVYVQEG